MTNFPDELREAIRLVEWSDVATAAEALTTPEQQAEARAEAAGENFDYAYAVALVARVPASRYPELRDHMERMANDWLDEAEDEELS